MKEVFQGVCLTLSPPIGIFALLFSFTQENPTPSLLFAAVFGVIFLWSLGILRDKHKPIPPQEDLLAESSTEPETTNQPLLAAADLVWVSRSGREIPVTMYKVSSDFIESVGHSGMYVYIRMKKGDTYCYEDPTAVHYDIMLHSDSPGSHYNKYLKRKKLATPP